MDAIRLLLGLPSQTGKSCLPQRQPTTGSPRETLPGKTQQLTHRLQGTDRDVTGLVPGSGTAPSTGPGRGLSTAVAD